MLSDTKVIRKVPKGEARDCRTIKITFPCLQEIVSCSWEVTKLLSLIPYSVESRNERREKGRVLNYPQAQKRPATVQFMNLFSG